jgi:hypothetical protein
MIFARGTKDGDDILIIGLSHRNVVRMINGEPITIKRAVHGDGVPEGWQIMIFTDKDEAAMARGLKKIGLIDESTPTHPSKTLGTSDET